MHENCVPVKYTHYVLLGCQLLQLSAQKHKDNLLHNILSYTVNLDALPFSVLDFSSIQAAMLQRRENTEQSLFVVYGYHCTVKSSLYSKVSQISME